jgi:hypothetical protein
MPMPPILHALILLELAYLVAAPVLVAAWAYREWRQGRW